MSISSTTQDLAKDGQAASLAVFFCATYLSQRRATYVAGVFEILMCI
jgi:hypothetical protein